MLYIITGVGVIVLSVVLFILRNKTKSQILEMKYLKTSKASELKELHRTLTNEVGPEGIKQLAELKGNSRIINPLVSEITKTECIGYNFTITENFEEEYETKDKDGKIVRQTRRGSNVVASNSRFNYFMLSDDSGEIQVDPEGAEMDLVKSTERHEPYNGGVGFLQFGSFSLNISNYPHRRITGYNIQENILPANRNLYIIGEMKDNNGSPIIRKPVEKDKPFIISQKTEEETIKQKESSTKILLITSIVLAAAGVALSIFGITSIL